MTDEPDEIDRAAQSLHADFCRRRGIQDPQSTALYWTSCDQNMYRTQASIAQTIARFPKVLARLAEDD